VVQIGGKSGAAEVVWEALGDVEHYVEPFFGSGAVLLGRPHQPNRNRHSETVNDLDGLLVNAWRAIQWHPDATAEAASWPVSELDKHARSVALTRWRDSEAVARLAGDARWCDPEMGGWWLWCVAAQIGPWGQGGPWWPDDTGLLRKGARQSGVTAQLPSLAGEGRGVNRPFTRERGLGEGDDFHPVTMPELRRWFGYLSARLRHVRIVSGDWSRVVTAAAVITVEVRFHDGFAGVFLDPPYGDVGRVSLYGKHEDFTVAEKVRAWALTRGDNPQWRIVYAGYDEEGADLEAAGWRAVEWFKHGFLTGGMGNVSGTAADGSKGHQQHRERLWLSPHCVQPINESEGALW
jgi:DNA adenine methylase